MLVVRMNDAVVTGMSHTGRLVTSAAAVLVLAFVALASGPVVSLKMFATAVSDRDSPRRHSRSVPTRSSFHLVARRAELVAPWKEEDAADRQPWRRKRWARSRWRNRRKSAGSGCMPATRRPTKRNLSDAFDLDGTVRCNGHKLGLLIIC